MDKLAQMAARHEAERARLEAELRIAALMPIAPDACQAGTKGAPWISYRKRTLREALAIFQAFRVMPVYHGRDTFGHILPESIMPAGATIKAGPFACWLRVTQGEGFGPTADLSFFAEVEGAPYRINVGIEGPDYIGACNAFRPTVDERRDGITGRGRVIARTYRANALLNGLCDKVIKWGGLGLGGIERSGDHTYLICADDDATAPGGENTHACGQLANIADALQPRGEG